MNLKSNCCVILGGYVNGYSIIRELNSNNVDNIILIDSIISLSSKSKYIDRFIKIKLEQKNLLDELIKLNKFYKKLIIFPTSDLYLELLHEIYDDIKNFCYIHFNNENIINSMDKFVQYNYCKKINIPYPKTIKISSKKCLEKINLLSFPIIIKPITRNDLKSNVFRNKVFQFFNKSSYSQINKFLNEGIQFIASEIIPGDDTNVYSYICFRSKKGLIVNEWIGKKLNQHPDNFGVFSSATNNAPRQILEMGRKIVNEMKLHGISQPEFKYDARDNTYKLTEINLRFMMWNRLGFLSNVNLAYNQYLDALNINQRKYSQDLTTKIHFVYLKHELLNLFRRKKYLKYFINNVFRGNKIKFAVFNIKDLKPFFFDIFTSLIKKYA